MTTIRRSLAVLAVVSCAAASNAIAQTTGANNRSDITNDATVDWSVLGSNGTLVPNNTVVNVAGGTTMTLSNANGATMQRFDQGNGWGGNFNPGDHLLYSGDFNGPLSFTFSNGIFGFGANIQANYYGFFTGVIRAYDGSNNLLGSFSGNGNSNGNGDGSAIFLGINSSLAIGRIEMDVIDSNGDHSLGINSVTMDLHGPASTVTPEPVSMALLGTGLAGVAAARRRKRQTGAA